MDIRARSISFWRLGPEGQKGHLITNALARPFSDLFISTLQTLVESESQKLFWISALGAAALVTRAS